MTLPILQLGSTTLSQNSPPYVIAEIGVNHEGSMELAKLLIDEAHAGGAHAAKFQTYKADKLAIKDSPAYWDLNAESTTTQHALFSKYDQFGAVEYEELAAYCAEVGIDFVSTPFDYDAVDLLDPLVPFFKIASADLVNVPLLRKVATTNKPVVLSTGASTLAEIDKAVHELAEHGCHDVSLLQCTLNYPCAYDKAHIGMIDHLRALYPNHLIGYSDHTVPDPHMAVLIAAWMRGAVVLEKHFTHDKTLPGNDHYHAMDVNDLKVFTENVRLLSQVVGQHKKIALPEEKPARKHARRSVVANRDLKTGEVLKEVDLTYKRPASGIPVECWDEVVGQVLARPVDKDTPLQWADLIPSHDSDG